MNKGKGIRQPLNWEISCVSLQKARVVDEIAADQCYRPPSQSRHVPLLAVDLAIGQVAVAIGLCTA